MQTEKKTEQWSEQLLKGSMIKSTFRRGWNLKSSTFSEGKSIMRKRETKETEQKPLNSICWTFWPWWQLTFFCYVYLDQLRPLELCNGIVNVIQVVFG